ncbi:PGPGW domain-containing protein [Paraglaciecola sp.]|uniref:PGPGW domain-containing protein n=1 Tax=Paraglaciecola sp. TaxID=1920173 RepID=UPI0030F4059E
MLTDSYNNIATYLMETFGANFIFLTILLSTVVSVVYFVVISYFITQMDKRYFVRKKISGDDSDQNPHATSMNSIVIYVTNIAKILVGLFLLVCGIAMLVLPGQGLLTILIALSLIPFPGKDKLEQNVLARKSVRSSLNWIRIKANKEPFIFD